MQRHWHLHGWPFATGPCAAECSTRAPTRNTHVHNAHTRTCARTHARTHAHINYHRGAEATKHIGTDTNTDRHGHRHRHRHRGRHTDEDTDGQMDGPTLGSSSPNLAVTRTFPFSPSLSAAASPDVAVFTYVHRSGPVKFSFSKMGSLPPAVVLLKVRGATR
jgi:hypothetical protein